MCADLPSLIPRPVLLIVLVPLLLVPAARPSPGAPAAAPSTAGPTDEACSGEAHRQFDFWRGSWEVRADGEPAGSNEIRTVAGGCGLEETWSGAGGEQGTSLSYYDPSDGRWHQLWVGSGGLILHLAGGLEDGSMVLSGTRGTGGETTHDRITWRPLPDGEVRQLWEVSRDGGETWSRAFDGRYRPR